MENKRIYDINGIDGAKSRNLLLFIILMVLMILLFGIDIITGSVKIPAGEVFRILAGSDTSQWSVIVLKFRIPKAITAMVAGMALSVSGLQMQTIFRNPMAGPYVLGVSSGASLGVALVILGFAFLFPSAVTKIPGDWLVIASACVGAGLIMIFVTYLAVRVRDILTVLILGIMIAGGISAIVTILQYFTSESLLRAYVIWTMGSLGNLTISQLWAMVLTVLAGITISLFTIKAMNVLLLGENYARSTGVNVKVARVAIFISTSLLAGGITAFCGPIGFIGIAVPHIARMLFRTSDNKVLLPASAITGAAVMLLSDIISQMPGSDKVLPVNAVTSLLGIPVVIWVILKGRMIKTGA
ncbi:MAG: iron ABC transporter permease [Bacteroidales bacterium]